MPTDEPQALAPGSLHGPSLRHPRKAGAFISEKAGISSIFPVSFILKPFTPLPPKSIHSSQEPPPTHPA